MKIDRTHLDSLIYDVSLQTTKIHHLEEAHLAPSDEQKQKTHTACVNLIEQLLIIIHDLESEL